MQATATSPQRSHVDLAQDLSVLYVYIQRTCGQDFLQAVDDLEMSLTQVKALHRLADSDEMRSLKALTKDLAISLPAASRAIDGLHQRGLVERHEVAEDRRMKEVRITAKGSDVVRRLAEARRADLERFAATLSERERQRLAAALAPILARDEVAACCAMQGVRR